MFYCLLSQVASTLTGVCSVDAVEIGPEAYLPSFYLRDNRADCSGQVPVYFEDLLVRSRP